MSDKTTQEIMRRLAKEYNIAVLTPLQRGWFLLCEVGKPPGKSNGTLIRMMAEAGADLTITSGGMNALMWAAWHGYPEVTRLLIEKGSPLYAASRRYGDAAEIAERRGKAQCLAILESAMAEKPCDRPSGVFMSPFKSIRV